MQRRLNCKLWRRKNVKGENDSMSKIVKIALTVSSIATVCAGIVYIVNKKREETSIKEELFATFRLYEEYAGTDEMHVREVIARNNEGKLVKKDSWMDGDDTGSVVHELTEKEIRTLKNYLTKEMKWSVPFSHEQHPYHKELFDAYSRVAFTDGSEYEVNAALEL